MARAKKMTLRAARVNTISKVSGKSLTIKEAADLIGVHYQTLRKWELGKSKPTIDKVFDICKTYHISIDNLNL